MQVCESGVLWQIATQSFLIMATVVMTWVSEGLRTERALLSRLGVSATWPEHVATVTALMQLTQSLGK